MQRGNQARLTKGNAKASSTFLSKSVQGYPRGTYSKKLPIQCNYYINSGSRYYLLLGEYKNVATSGIVGVEFRG